MKNYICTTCGIQFTASAQSLDACPICKDEREYVIAKQAVNDSAQRYIHAVSQ